MCCECRYSSGAVHPMNSDRSDGFPMSRSHQRPAGDCSCTPPAANASEHALGLQARLLAIAGSWHNPEGGVRPGGSAEGAR